MSIPDLVAEVKVTSPTELTFSTHCFRAPPTSDAAFGSWLFAEVLKAAAGSRAKWRSAVEAHATFDELLRQLGMCAWKSLPLMLQTHFECGPRAPLPDLIWEDGRALPRFETQMSVEGAAGILNALPTKLFFECREAIDEIEFVEPHAVPPRPSSGLVPLLVRAGSGRIPWPTHGFVPGEILGHPWGRGASPPARGGTDWVIISVHEEGAAGAPEGGWIDRRGTFEELKAALDADAPSAQELTPHMEVEVGDGEEALVGEKGVARAGSRGTAIAGDGGEAVVGNHGSARAGVHGTATAGMKGTAVVGDGGTATAGHMGSATAGDRGVARVGRKGKAHAGVGGRVAGGTGAELSVNVSDGRVETVVVGSNGVETELLYRYLPEGSAELHRGQKPGWVRAYS